MTIDWRRYVDPDRLGGCMDHHQLGTGPIEAMMLLTGATQNVLVRFTRGGRDYVLRRPTDPANSHIIAHKTRILAALTESDVLAPALIAKCDEDAVLGCLKLAVVLEGTQARAAADQASRDTWTYLHRLAVDFLHRTQRWM